MGQRRIDAKDLSPVPVEIGNRRELELKRKSQRDDANDPQQEDTGYKYRHKRSKSRSRSLSRDDVQEDFERQHKKTKFRRNHPNDDLSKDAKTLGPGNTSAPPGETEEEYDARLEREENERLAAERRRHLERFKQLDNPSPKDGIRFKGRGRMKFIDPEISQRQS
ncbi:hypothetical protein EYR40_007861 [Pleurotus pulmonarius]|nr:hypothetical protein EYR38_007831 [Pleurotus pulmonarius]KAF4597409.1 hypothetical protein EYR40_007861 [Pleurotus pulmonarius]